MKTLTKQQFDALLERRINLIARSLKEQIATAENNPEHLAPTTAAATIGFLGNAVEAFKASLEAIISRPQPGDIGEFSLGGKKEPRKPRADKGVKRTAPVAESAELSEIKRPTVIAEDVDLPAAETKSTPVAMSRAAAAKLHAAALPAALIDDLDIEELMAAAD